MCRCFLANRMIRIDDDFNVQSVIAKQVLAAPVGFHESDKLRWIRQSDGFAACQRRGQPSAAILAK